MSENGWDKVRIPGLQVGRSVLYVGPMAPEKYADPLDKTDEHFVKEGLGYKIQVGFKKGEWFEIHVPVTLLAWLKCYYQSGQPCVIERSGKDKNDTRYKIRPADCNDLEEASSSVILEEQEVTTPY